MLKKLTLMALPVLFTACATSNTFMLDNSRQEASIGGGEVLKISAAEHIELAFDRSITAQHRQYLRNDVKRILAEIEETFKPAEVMQRPLKLVFTNNRKMDTYEGSVNTIYVDGHVLEPQSEFELITALFRYRVNPQTLTPTNQQTTVANQYSILAAWAGVHLMRSDLRRHELIARLYLDHVSLSDNDRTTQTYISHVDLPNNFPRGVRGGFNAPSEPASKAVFRYQRKVLSPLVALGMDALMRELSTTGPNGKPLLIDVYNDAIKQKTDLITAFDRRVKNKNKSKILRGWLAGNTIPEGYVFRGVNRNDERILPTLNKPVYVKGPLGEAEVFLWKEDPKAAPKKRVFLVTHKTFSQRLPLPKRMDRYYRRLLVDLLPHGDVLVVHRPNIGGAKGAYESYGGCQSPDYMNAANIAGSYITASAQYLQALGYNHIVALGQAAGGIAVVEGARTGLIEQVFTFNAGRGVQNNDVRCADTSSMDVMVDLRKQVTVPVIHIASNQDLRYTTDRRRKLLEASGDETIWYDMPAYTDGHYLIWYHTDLWLDDVLKRLKPLP